MSQVCPICNNEIDDQVASCPFCGFRLLGSTQSFQPVKVEEEANAGTYNKVRSVESRELRVVRGPQTGMVIGLKEGLMTIGRDPQCDIFLNDMTVSRSHATIEIDEKGCVITDTNSFNGIWVNDRLVDACLLKSGDMIQIGAFCLVYKD